MSKYGFTLVELSIVLVIIGLLVGAVITGTELVAQSKFRNQIKQFEEINRAATTFRSKYGQLPGDIRNATRFFTASSQPNQVTNGDGDGRIRTSSTHVNPSTGLDYAHVTGANEWYRFFDHLAVAELWTETPAFDEGATADRQVGIAFPAFHINPQNNTTGIMVAHLNAFDTYTAGNKILIGGILGWGGAQMGFTNSITTIQAFTLDQKLDDGKPYTGRMRSLAQDRYVYRTPNSGINFTGNCSTYATNTYIVPQLFTNQGCSVYLDANF